MDSVNIFRAENHEGRVDVGEALGSSDTLMFIYDVGPGSANRGTTTSTTRSGCSSSTALSCCAHRMGSTPWSAGTSSASQPVPLERTSC